MQLITLWSSYMLNWNVTLLSIVFVFNFQPCLVTPALSPAGACPQGQLQTQTLPPGLRAGQMCPYPPHQHGTGKINLPAGLRKPSCKAALMWLITNMDWDRHPLPSSESELLLSCLVSHGHCLFPTGLLSPFFLSVPCRSSPSYSK